MGSIFHEEAPNGLEMKCILYQSPHCVYGIKLTVNLMHRNFPHIRLIYIYKEKQSHDKNIVEKITSQLWL